MDAVSIPNPSSPRLAGVPAAGYLAGMSQAPLAAAPHELAPRPQRQWYYAAGGSRHGPVDQAAFEAMIEVGQVVSETLVWTPGMTQWSRADYIVELQPLIARHMPKAPPTVQGAMASPPAAAPGGDGGMSMILPTGRSPWAIVAGYVALFSVLLIPAPFAVGLGIVALRDIKKNPHLMGSGRAWFAIIFGGIITLGAGGVMIAAALDGR